MNRVLWIAQRLLAAVLVFAGDSKLITPPEVMTMMSPFPVTFVQFVGVCEFPGHWV